MLVLQPVKERTLEASEPYFHQIAGFFIVENTVLETTTLIVKSVVENLWDYAVAKMKVRFSDFHCRFLTLALFL